MRNGSFHKQNATTTPRPVRYSQDRRQPSELRETVDAVSSVLEDLPPADNAAGAVEKMLRANAILRNVPWPPPFDETKHRLHEATPATSPSLRTRAFIWSSPHRRIGR